MRYGSTETAFFVSRQNRFVAVVDGDRGREKVHVKNTGRCRELLVPGARVILARSDNPSRKYSADLVAVYKGGMLVNMDSQAPNSVVKESFDRILPGCGLVDPEHTMGDSRFDFYAEMDDRRILLEVKGVTLEKDGTAMFPDAPTERGLKHVKELESLSGEGYDCYVFLLVQMKGPTVFTPNYDTDPAFSEALRHASDNGVTVLAYDCEVSEDSLTLGFPVDIVFRPRAYSPYSSTYSFSASQSYTLDTAS